MITILLVDDHEIFRQGLTMLLGAQDDFNVIGQAADGEQALDLAETLRPQVVVVDMLLPGMSGLELIYQFRLRLPEMRLVALSMYADESYVVTALRYGAVAYVLKDASATDLVQAIRSAARGHNYLSPALTERAIRAYIQQGEVPGKTDADEFKRLTARERDVLRLTMQGLSAAEVGRQLSISPRTVETHRAHLLHKFRVHSLDELGAIVRRLSPGV